jgi:four helix bundle protein
MPIRRLQDLRVWHEAIALAVDVDALVAPFERGVRAGLADQLHRAATSIHSGIAEGFGRRTLRDRAYYYTVAWSSLLEVESHLTELLATKRTNPAPVRACLTRARHVARLLAAFRRSDR